MARKKRVFAWSPLRALMKKAGAEIVSRDAVGTLMDQLEKRAKGLTENAIKLAKHSKRKKVTKADMTLAIGL
jgi:histone H3/H4